MLSTEDGTQGTMMFSVMNDLFYVPYSTSGQRPIWINCVDDDTQ
jgi:hypothetical protein